MKRYFSFVLGILGISLLFLNWGSICYFAKCYPTILKPLLDPIGRFTTNPTPNLPFFLWIILSSVVGFGFLIVFCFSIVGIWLGFREARFSSKSFAILGIILNFLTFCLSLFIAWLLFGLARGL